MLIGVGAGGILVSFVGCWFDIVGCETVRGGCSGADGVNVGVGMDEIGKFVRTFC